MQKPENQSFHSLLNNKKYGIITIYRHNFCQKMKTYT